MEDLPPTLAAWRAWEKHEHEPRDVWKPLEPWLEGELGYTLFGSTLGIDKALRKHLSPKIPPYTPNGFACLSPHLVKEYTDWGHFVPSDVRRCFSRCSTILKPAQKTVHVPALAKDGQGVLIRLVAKGGDGQTALKAYRRLAKSPTSFLPANHILPFIAELVKLDMTFLVSPLVGQISFDRPWFYAFSEVIDAVKHILQVRLAAPTRSEADMQKGVAFCHDRLVAHRVRKSSQHAPVSHALQDLCSDNILHNVYGWPLKGEHTTPNAFDAHPYRSLVSIRYYMIDLELAVVYDPETPESERRVRGLPVLACQRRGKYARRPAPEMLTGRWHCPFKADVFQLGDMFGELFGVCGPFFSSPWSNAVRMPRAAPRRALRAARRALRPHA
jgi:hypothetical protein